MPVPDIDKQVPTGQGRTVNAANDKKKSMLGLVTAFSGGLGDLRYNLIHRLSWNRMGLAGLTALHTLTYPAEHFPFPPEGLHIFLWNF